MIKESIFEINHAKHLSEEIGIRSDEIFEDNCEIGIRSDEIFEDNCDAYESVSLDKETLSKVNPFLFPLAIEFALTGAIFFYRMLKKVGER